MSLIIVWLFCCMRICSFLQGDADLRGSNSSSITSYNASVCSHICLVLNTGLEMCCPNAAKSLIYAITTTTKFFHVFRFWGLQSSLCFNVKYGKFEGSGFIVFEVQFVLVCTICNFWTLNCFEGVFVFLRMCCLLSSCLSICVFVSFKVTLCLPF